MANTNNSAPEVDNTGNADNDAWIETAKACKYRVEGGQVWAGVRPNGFAAMLFPVPAMPGFAGLPATAKSLVLRSTIQFVTYRVAQNAEGDVNVAVAAAMTAGTLPSMKSADAFESMYLSEIRDRIAAALKGKKGSDGKDMTATPAQIEATAEAKRGELFDGLVKAAIAASRSRAAKDRKRQPRKTVEAIAI